MTAVITWFFRSKLGNALGLALVIVGCWFLFSRYYDNIGYQRCKTEQAEAVGKANVILVEGERKRDATSDTISEDAAAKTDKAVDDITKAGNTTKEAITDEYRKPITAPAVALGSCAYPLRSGVQKRLDAAVDQVNAADGGLQAR